MAVIYRYILHTHPNSQSSCLQVNVDFMNICDISSGLLSTEMFKFKDSGYNFYIKCLSLEGVCVFQTQDKVKFLWKEKEKQVRHFNHHYLAILQEIRI